METQANIPEVEDSKLKEFFVDRINKLVEAVRAMDLDRVMSFYAPDMISFDMVPPLQHLGAEAKRKNWAAVFAMYQRPLGYEIRELSASVGNDLAFAHSLNRISGTLKNGNRNDLWLRWSTCFRKVDGDWLIAHDHVSVPLDEETGKALLDLKP
jgi:ketosteroid isomerase-like protein